MEGPHYEFVQFTAFSKQLDKANDPDLLPAIEEELKKSPEAGVLLKGGIRKVRIPSPSGARGKRGGFRVWHYFYKVGEKFSFSTSWTSGRPRISARNTKNCWWQPSRMPSTRLNR